MTKRRLVLSATALGLLLILFYLWANREPRYQGHSLTYWMRYQGTGGAHADFTKSAEAIRSIGVDGLPIIMRELRSKEPSLWEGFEKLAVWVEFKTGVTLSSFASEYPQVRRNNAVDAIGMLGAEAAPAIPELVHNTEDPEIASDSAVALGLIGEPAFPEILRLSKSTNMSARCASAVALAQFPGDQRASEALQQLMKDDSADVRLIALREFEYAESDPAIKVTVFEQRVEDADAEIRRIACESLGKLGSDALPAITTLSNAMTQVSTREAAAYALSQIGPACLPVFRALQTHVDGEIRAEAVKGIIRQSKWTSIDYSELLPLLHDSEWQVRNLAIMGLRRLTTNDARIVAPVLGALEEEQNDAVRSHLLMALAQVGEPASNALPLLFKLQAQSSGDLKNQYLRTIAVIDPSAARELGANEELMALARASQTLIRRGFQISTRAFSEMPAQPPMPHQP